ncbi:single-stranded-DNA-specific exonuclease RecJ [Rhodospirillaceae bacterium KN72]|uniref:Single-stranded-DNA-specific exonuclease RecJ n=1 Tax=Pacificispira spongiicola TaxID=2729598 RepID=A0A7Y0E2Y6_9PROT|nr:single-stranded-DNA-specific exonuclease RecJ [Pacificispira spongiicola]NMM46272.1 single-stranded-DNA-specific exonuclease RecJ [Pacificispira spongiicola]
MTTAEPEAFLGVSRSASGKRWEARPDDARLTAALAQRYSLPEPVARAMAARGIDLDAAEAFLDPKLSRDLPDPSHLRDMDAAVSRLVAAIREGEGIAVFGDYDVDGATSSALLLRYIRAAGGRIEAYIPDRLAEGYGPNLPALVKLKQQGAAVVITVDCGITAFDVLGAAADEGVEVLVVDHHVAEPRLPRAVAVVNPNRLDEDSPHGNMAAVGVTFLLIVALNRRLRAEGWFDGKREPDLMGLLDLVALGTVCDVVPLTGVNRALVAQGLKVMARRGNIGLSALADVARVSEAPGTYHAGFLLGPRVNSGGRVGEAGLGTELLSTEDAARAQVIAQRLDAYNEERRAIEKDCLDAAIAQVEASGDEDAPVIVAVAEGWHPGVIGIVAGRLKERYNRPACVVALDDDGIGKGSGRSVPGIDLGSAVIAARQQDLLINGGGHKMAAGFTVSAANLSGFVSFLRERIALEAGEGGLVPVLKFDGAVTAAGASLPLVEALERLQPFGQGNAEPRFVLPEVRLYQADIVGEDHVRVLAGDAAGGRVKGIAFRCADTPLGQALLRARGDRPIHLAGRLRKDSWQGRESVQLMIDDAAEL